MTEEAGSGKRQRDDTSDTEQADCDGEEWKKLTGLVLPKHGKIVRGKQRGNYDAFVSSHGRIKRVHVKNERVVWTTGNSDRKDGYKRVKLAVKSKAHQNAFSKNHRVHQLVYLAFHHVAGEEWPEHVRHLDGDHTNNCRENVAGGTQSDNVQDSIRHGTFSSPFGSGKRVKQIDKTTGDVIATHDSVNAAARAVHGHHSAVSDCCLGKRRTHGGFRWEFD